MMVATRRRNVPYYGLVEPSARILTKDTPGATQQDAPVLIDGTIFTYQVPKRQFLQFLRGQQNGHTLWFYLRTAVPAEIPDDSIIKVQKLDADGNYVATIWEGTYGEIPAEADRHDREQWVLPLQDVRLNEGDILAVKVTSTVTIISANSRTELRCERWAPARM